MSYEQDPSRPEFRMPPDYNVQLLLIGELNSCAQYRNGNNPAQTDLNKSIARRGLINLLTVAILDRGSTEEYIKFTNRVWKSEVSIEDFHPLESDDSFYAVMVAGHSRLAGLKEDAKSSGYDPMHYYERVRVIDDIESVDDILAWQTEENIHATVAPQNLAKVLAESWLWIQKQAENGGERISKKEFARRHRIGEQALRDALNYVELPPVIRNLTDNEVLPYSIAVELGRSVKTLREFATSEDGFNENLFETELLILAHRYINSGQIINARQQIRARTQSMRETLDSPAETQQSLEGFFSLVEEISPEERAKMELRNLLSQGKDKISLGHIKLHNAIAQLAKEEELQVSAQQHEFLLASAQQKLGAKAIKNHPDLADKRAA